MAKNVLNKTGIEWVDFTWNPVTGCRHNCPYCYAKPLAEMRYPEGFEPTFRPERLTITRKKPATIFVCSMADLFGAWVPDEWIEAVMQAAWDCPQHQYLFLTKNPARYDNFLRMRNCLYGATATNQKQWNEAFRSSPDGPCSRVDFISAEPLLGPIEPHGIEQLKWLILGADSNKGAEKPERKWGNDLVTAAEKAGVPVFVKKNWPYHNSYGYRENPPRFEWPRDFPEGLKP